jgi:carbon-monoxide dehydrogenase small subunit
MLLTLRVNGQALTQEVEPRTLLVEFLRETLGLTGTHVGCDTGQCGACTVLLDGRAVKSCLVLAVQAEGRAVTTIEGVAPAEDRLHPVQQAFKDHHALQCGFCTPGMVMTALDIAAHHKAAGPDEVKALLSGNLCRCTGYAPIVEAVMAAKEGM